MVDDFQQLRLELHSAAVPVMIDVLFTIQNRAYDLFTLLSISSFSLPLRSRSLYAETNFKDGDRIMHFSLEKWDRECQPVSVSPFYLKVQFADDR